MSLSKELDQLLDRVVSGAAESDEVKALDRHLIEDATIREEYVRRMLLEIDLRQQIESVALVRAVSKLKHHGISAPTDRHEVSGDRPSWTTPHAMPDRWLTDQTSKQGDIFELFPRSSVWSIRKRNPRGSRRRRATLAFVAAAACLVVVLSDWGSRPDQSISQTTSPDRDRGAPVSDIETERSERPVVDESPQRSAAPNGLLVVDADEIFATSGGADRVQLVCGEGEYAVTPNQEMPLTMVVRRGQVAATMPVVLPDAEVIAGPLSITAAGASFGVERSGDRVRVVVFSGEAVVKHTDRRRPWRLTRDEGLEVLPDGSVLSALVGGHQRFAELQKRLIDQRPRLANPNFSYPMLASLTGDSLGRSAARVPAGWTLASHPIANADGMMSGGGLAVIESAVPASVDGDPTRASSGQAAYCEASMLPDGKTTWSSLYQQAGTIAAGDTIDLTVEVGSSDQPARDVSEGRVMLFYGEEDEGPLVQLAESVARLHGDRAETSVHLNLVLPTDSEAVGRTLYVVLAAVPPTQPGTTRVHFRHVNLSVETGE